jgi:hypothetical protein
MRIANGWRQGRFVILITTIAAGAMLGGCQTAEYHGASPSARYFNESPRQVREFYLGFNFNFSLDRPDDYHHGAPMAMADLPSPSQAQASIQPESDADSGD